MSFISSLGEWLRKVSKSFMNASVSGKNITLTRHNGDTVTLITQDTVYTHPTTSGNKHIPSGGSSGQILRWSADGTAVWGNDNNTTYTIGTASGSGNAITALSISGGTITPTLGKTFSESDHTHSYLPLSGGTMTGGITFSEGASATSGTYTHLTGTMAANDGWRIASGATASNAGFLEIATRDDGNEPIYVRQYTGNFATLKRTLTLLDASGNSVFPGRIDATSFNGFTIEKSVPADAKFTDTVYTHPTTAGNKHIPSGGSNGQILRWSADGTAAWGADNNTTYPAFSTAHYINAGGYVDAMVFYDNDAQSNRASVIRVTNGNGYHELLLGVNNESNGAPGGFTIRNTNGTITASLNGKLTVNDIKIGSGNIGSASNPVYINAGNITDCTQQSIYTRAVGNGYMCLNNGKQIVWHTDLSGTAGQDNVYTFSRAFKTVPIVLVGRKSGATTTSAFYEPWVRDVTTTQCKIYMPTFTGYYFLAVGEGAA